MDIDALLRMLERGQESAMLRFTLGNAYADQRRWAEAAEHYARAVDLDPGYSAAWQALGRARERAGEPADVLRDTYRHGLAAARERGDMQVVRALEVRLRRLERSA